MDAKRLAIGTIVGFLTLHIAGYLIFQVALADFALANRSSAANAFREPAMWLFFALGDFTFSILLALAIVATGTSNAVRGFITGAVMGLLIWLGANLVTYGYADLWTLTLGIAFPIFAGIQWGIAGALVAAVLARVPASTAGRPAE